MRTFEIEVQKSPHLIEMFKIDASDVVGALDKLHKLLQRKQGIAHDSYSLVSIHHVYNGSIGSVDLIRSPYPVPGGKNPNVEPAFTKPLQSSKSQVD